MVTYYPAGLWAFLGVTVLYLYLEHFKEAKTKT